MLYFTSMNSFMSSVVFCYLFIFLSMKRKTDLLVFLFIHEEFLHTFMRTIQGIKDVSNRPDIKIVISCFAFSLRAFLKMSKAFLRSYLEAIAECVCICLKKFWL
mmetsp:Transcript_39566/g.40324  ORF Transcript_39566/g.40324 Transcript_39566/m.40324 type:complete len:104 (+) Transcript_39566:85-396(+)